METRFGEVLARAQAAGRAVGAFTCYDLLGFEAVVRAAESRGAPVVVLVSSASFGAEGGERLVRAFGAAARGSSADVLGGIAASKGHKIDFSKLTPEDREGLLNFVYERLHGDVKHRPAG